MPPVPEGVSGALDAYAAGLRGVFAGGLAGVYLHGSVAWSAYSPTVSDVDAGRIRGKTPAARWALGEVQPRWRRTIERTVTRYETGDLASSDPLLAREAEGFAAYVREAAGR